jgi:membrane protein implicated in regulation of membrane protease activity
MLDLFANLGDWAWWIIAGIMFLLELLAPAFFFLWFAFAALVTGLIVLFVPMGWQMQAATFAVLTIMLLLISRKIFGRTGWSTDKPLLNQRMASFVGKSFVLETPIRNREGKVRINDTVWKVEGPDTPAGAWVKVISAEGAVLVVEPDSDRK